MATVSLFWLEFITFMLFTSNSFNFYSTIEFSVVPALLLGFLMPTVFLLILKPIWEKYNQMKKVKSDFNKMKFDENVIKALSESKPIRSTLDSQAMLVYGNKTDKNKDEQQK